jgi:hypothetical protein
VTIQATTSPSDQWDRLGDIERSAQSLLATLDQEGLHQAAAYVSMALDVMRQNRLDRVPTA